MAEEPDFYDDDPPADLRAALEDLLHQIDISEFKDRLGHRLKMNAAYQNAKAMLAAEDAIARARRMTP